MAENKQVQHTENSDAVIDENLIANEYEFMSNGEIA